MMIGWGGGDMAEGLRRWFEASRQAVVTGQPSETPLNNFCCFFHISMINVFNFF